MGGKYEVRYFIDGHEYTTEYTNSFFKFAKLMLTKKVIYFKIITC